MDVYSGVANDEIDLSMVSGITLKAMAGAFTSSSLARSCGFPYALMLDGRLNALIAASAAATLELHNVVMAYFPLAT